MVLKKSKYGGNTGNTLRKTSWYTGKLRTASFVETTVKSNTKIPFQEEVKSPKSWLNDGGLTKDKNPLNSKQQFVHYSLNKNKRWHLHNDLTSQLHEYKSQNGEKMGKTLGNRNEKVAVIVKPGEWLPLSARRNNFIKSLKDSDNIQKNFENHSWRSSGRITGDYDKTYIFTQAFPSVTYPQLTAKMPTLNSSDKVSMKKRKSSSHNHVTYESDDSFDEMDFDVRDDVCCNDFEIESDISQEEELVPSRIQKYNIIDFVKGKRKRKNFKPMSSHLNNIDMADKTHVRFIENPSSNLVEESIEDEHLEQIDVEPLQSFTITVMSESIRQERLQQHYAESYIEGDCFPRCFALCFHKQADVIASFECTYTENDMTNLLVKVFSPQNVQEFSVDNIISDYSHVDFDSLVDFLFPDLKKLSTATSASKHTDDLKYILPTRAIQSMFFESICNKNHTSQSSFKNNNHVTCKTDVCVVCLDESPLMELKYCGHLFCDNCWQTYINTKISLGNTKIACLDFECNENINFATVMKYALKRNLSCYYKLLMNNLILEKASVKVCPNDKCNHIAEIIEDNKKEEASSLVIKKETPIVRCVCKRNWCFQCQNDAHWPISCHIRDQYEQQLKKDLNVLFDKYGRGFETVVNYRICPHCKSKIVKNGGCPYMACICGNAFCWHCLRSFDDHDDEYCTDMKLDNTVVFSSLDEDLSNSSKAVKIFRKALQYKVARSDISSLKRKLKVTKMLHKFRCDVEAKSRLLTVAKAFDILNECYNIMENLSLAFTEKNCRNYRVRKCLDTMFWYSRLVWNNLDVKNISEINLLVLENHLSSIDVLVYKLRHL